MSAASLTIALLGTDRNRASSIWRTDSTFGPKSEKTAFKAEEIRARIADFSPERLRIGKFCQIAHGVRFVTSSANHRHDGISTFPFAIFGGGVEGRPSMPGDPCASNSLGASGDPAATRSWSG